MYLASLHFTIRFIDETLDKRHGSVGWALMLSVNEVGFISQGLGNVAKTTNPQLPQEFPIIFLIHSPPLPRSYRLTGWVESRPSNAVLPFSHWTRLPPRDKNPLILMFVKFPFRILNHLVCLTDIRWVINETELLSTSIVKAREWWQI